MNAFAKTLLHSSCAAAREGPVLAGRGVDDERRRAEHPLHFRVVLETQHRHPVVVERLRLGVDESQVGMAVLVHYSFPDEIEMANGVATVEKIAINCAMRDAAI